MIISEKQVMMLIQSTHTLLAIGDSSFRNYFSTIKCIRAIAPQIIDLLVEIKDQQSEELKVIE